jgi:hypothetical protein
MADDDEPEKVWDEYDWERFLQQQDRKTEQYMELLERYMDDPNRDQIIAREMGWYHLLDKEGVEWEEKVKSLFEEVFEEDREDEAEPVNFLDEVHGYEVHPLYQASFALTLWINNLFEELGEAQGRPACVILANQTAVASAKLAGALSDDDVDEIGMTIAYLKRGLKAIITALDATAQVRAETKISPEQFATLNERLFQIRDGIITLMGQYRTEFRRRYDGH